MGNTLFKPDIKELEVQTTGFVMKEIHRCLEVLAETPSQPVDNSSFPYEYTKKELPLDSDGYIVAFEPTDTENIQKFFDDYGVVVVKNCLSASEIEESEREAWDFLERHSPKLKRDDPDTWVNENWPGHTKLGILGDMFVCSPQMKKNRYNKRITSAFACVMRTGDLVNSIGRLSMMRPTIPPKGRESWKTTHNWLHIDMCPCCGGSTTLGFKMGKPSAHSFNYCCGEYKGPHTFSESVGRLDHQMPIRVQGSLALRDCHTEHGGFHVVPGFHKHIRGWATIQNEIWRDKNSSIITPQTGSFTSYIPCIFRGSATTFDIPKDDPIRQDIQKVPVRAGSLTIWHSALPHGTFPCESSQGRLIQYIRMARADDEAFVSLGVQ